MSTNPLSSAVGTGEFYVSVAARTSASLRRVCRRSMRRALLRAATRVLRLQRCKRESAPAIGRTGAPLVLRVAEPELAREPRTPGAERQGSSAQARRLHELRSEFRFTSLAKKIRMTLAVIPQMRLRKHGSLPSTSRTRSRALVFLYGAEPQSPLSSIRTRVCPVSSWRRRMHSSVGRTACATSPASSVAWPTRGREAGTRAFPASTSSGRLPRRRRARSADRGSAGPFWQHVRDALAER